MDMCAWVYRGNHLSVLFFFRDTPHESDERSRSHPEPGFIITLCVSICLSEYLPPLAIKLMPNDFANKNIIARILNEMGFE